MKARRVCTDAVSDEQFETLLGRSVGDVVRQQAEVGIDVVSDGEFGKTISWSRYILERLNGFEDRPESEPRDDRSEAPTRSAHRCRALPRVLRRVQRDTGFRGRHAQPRVRRADLLRRAGRVAARHRQRQGRASTRHATRGYEVAAFLPVVAPASVAYKRQDVYYASEEEYVYAVADALREEYRAIIDAGLILQVDDAHLPMMYDNIVDPGTPDDFRRWAQLRIEALNHALEGIPRDRCRYHICWGSFNSPHVGDVAVPRDRRPRAVGERRRLRDRDGQPAPRARVARLARRRRCPTTSVLIPGVIAHTPTSSSIPSSSPSASCGWPSSSAASA